MIAQWKSHPVARGAEHDRERCRARWRPRRLIYNNVPEVSHILSDPKFPEPFLDRPDHALFLKHPNEAEQYMSLPLGKRDELLSFSRARRKRNSC